MSNSAERLAAFLEAGQDRQRAEAAIRAVCIDIQSIEVDTGIPLVGTITVSLVDHLSDIINGMREQVPDERIHRLVCDLRLLFA